MEIVSSVENVHKMSNYIFLGKKREKYFKLSFAEFFVQHAKS